MWQAHSQRIGHGEVPVFVSGWFQRLRCSWFGAAVPVISEPLQTAYRFPVELDIRHEVRWRD
jgi:hypothetical protein